MDPQIRLQLECVYEGLESGMLNPMDHVSMRLTIHSRDIYRAISWLTNIRIRRGILSRLS